MAQPSPTSLFENDLDAQFDVTDPRTVFWAEVDQLLESGHDPDAIGDVVRSADTTESRDRRRWWALVDSLAEVPRAAGWAYEEPEGSAEILASLPSGPAAQRPSDARIEDGVRAGWLGRIAGCTVGKPVEDGDVWTSDRLRRYLEQAGAWPLTGYVPVLDPMPAGCRLRDDNWRSTTLGNVDGAARDDDIDYAILGLHLLERHGTGPTSTLTTTHVARAWLELLPFHQVYTAERAAYRNLVQGVPVSEAASRRNPYREWIGAQIRGDAFGWTHPGDPRAAAALALHDAQLSHTGNGVYGEVWVAALVACAFTADSPRGALEASLQHVPPRSRLAEVLRFCLDQHAGGATWHAALAAVQVRYGRYAWIHTLNNAALVVLGLLYGEGDVAASIGYAVMGGWDTDSNGATVGSVAGVLAGTRGLPAHLVDPLRDSVRSALFGFDDSRISDLAARTARLALRP